MLIKTLIICIYTVCDLIYGHNLSVTADCETEYQLADVNDKPRYNVSIRFEDCDSDTYSFFRPSNLLHQHYSGSVSLQVRRAGGKRFISLEWDVSDNSTCNIDFFIGTRTIFSPHNIIHNNSQKCLHVRLKTVTTRDFRSEVDKLRINCFRVPSDIVGTMLVLTKQVGTRSGECFRDRSITFNQFNIGCEFSGAEVFVEGDCLDIVLQNLHTDIDLYKSRIYIYGQNNWRHSRGLKSSHYFGQRARKMYLPVNGQGSYNIMVELVCDTNGDIMKHTISLEKIVTDTSTCSNITTNPETTVQLASSQEHPDKHKGLAIILVISTLVCVVAITSTVSAIVHRIRQKEGQPRPDQQDADGVNIPLNVLHATTEPEPTAEVTDL